MRFFPFLILLFGAAWIRPVLASEVNFLARGALIQAGSDKNLLNARLFAAELATYRDVLLLNPGGQIPALAMSGLAEAYARAGSIVYVLENTMNLAILSPRLPAEFAAALRNNLENIGDIPNAVKVAQTSDLPFRVLGHSLGGAVLGEESGNANSLFQEILLLGVSRLVKKPNAATIKVTILLGENDGLAAREGVDLLAQFFKTSTVLLPAVNHFCIITDSTVGAADKKAQDRPTALSSAECVEALVRATTATTAADL
jgi:hypothetical protein